MALCCEIYGWRVVSPYKGAVIGIAFRRHGIYSISQEICTRFLRFAVLCCGYTLTDFPISIRLTSLALWQSNDCPSASKATLMNMDKYFMWIHYERLHNHNKAKHNKTVCISLGIYCMRVCKVSCVWITPTYWWRANFRLTTRTISKVAINGPLLRNLRVTCGFSL